MLGSENENLCESLNSSQLELSRFSSFQIIMNYFYKKIKQNLIRSNFDDVYRK